MTMIMILNNFLFNNAFQNVCRFRDIRGQSFAVLAPKTLYHVRYDLDIYMIRLRMSRATLYLPTLISNYWWVKNMFKRLLTLLDPNLRGQLLLFDIARNVLSLQTFVVLEVFRNSWSFFEILMKEIFWGRPRNSFTEHINHNWILLRAWFYATFVK